MAVSILLFCGCAENRSTTDGSGSGKITVVATLFPLYEFAKEVGGDRADVHLLLPPGAEAHTFEPKPSDIVEINDADVFFYVGAGMEPWAHDIIEGSDHKFTALDASSKVSLLKTSEEHEHDEGHAEEEHEHESEEHAEEEHEHETGEEENETGAAEEHEHQHGEYDPHIWLSFENDKKLVDAVASAYIEKDPAGRDYYLQNADNYKKRLDALDAGYRDALKSCRHRVFLTGGHSAYAYLARDYNLSYESAYGVSPDSEPTPARIKAITDITKEHGVKYILMEELVSPRLAEALAQESGAQVLVFNPAPNLKKEQFDNGTSFISLMEANKESLKKALECI